MAFRAKSKLAVGIHPNESTNGKAPLTRCMPKALPVENSITAADGACSPSIMAKQLS
ncbi:hypothetical protein IMZ48_22145 [Candidatus Bathyarchaeota archaeon]|nr:hypothetical protein [Candidatus Bathyarchaeota archaeon]